MEWDLNGKDLNSNNSIYLMLKKEIINEQINRGDKKSLRISSVLIKSILRSDKKIMIPTLDFSQIKEKLLETFIEGKIGNPK